MAVSVRFNHITKCFEQYDPEDIEDAVEIPEPVIVPEKKVIAPTRQVVVKPKGK